MLSIYPIVQVNPVESIETRMHNNFTPRCLNGLFACETGDFGREVLSKVLKSFDEKRIRYVLYFALAAQNVEKLLV